MSSSYGYGVKA